MAKKYKCIIFSFLSGAIICACSSDYCVKSGDLEFRVDKKEMRIKMASSLTSDYQDAEKLITDQGEITFSLKEVSKEKISDEFGEGIRYSFKGEGKNSNGAINKTLDVSVYSAFPSTVILSTDYSNNSGAPLNVLGWKSCALNLKSAGDDPDFWSFQGESTESRADWLLPVKDGFSQRNYMGMNNSDYGGGVPVVCLWRKDSGVEVGHLSSHPELVSLPVRMSDGSASIAIEKDYPDTIVVANGASLRTLKTFVHVFKGDCFGALRTYSELLAKEGVVMPESEPAAFESAWCAWGYGRNFTIDEIIGTLPKVKELGIKWATLDDGYQVAEGDWTLNRARFPGGERDMKRITDAIHSAGLKAQLWWAPMCSDSGTAFLEQHPESLILSKDGKPQEITWWDSRYLSPLDSSVRNETRNYVRKVLGEWGFDGFKLDGQYMNAVPPDYNQARNGEKPTACCEKLPTFFKLIYDTAREVKPHAVIQNCPCGDCVSIYNLQYANQTVASDPESSWQVRLKGYVLRALAPKTAYYGDHVELTDGHDDFPTQLGIGAVLGTKFTYPKDNPYEKEANVLTPEREKIWRNAFSIYNEKMLSQGELVPGLYDIGYDRPETYVIEKDGRMYYAFYQKGDFSSVELRGLEKGETYTVTDYYNHKALGNVIAEDKTVLTGHFKDYLLIETLNNTNKK